MPAPLCISVIARNLSPAIVSPHPALRATFPKGEGNPLRRDGERRMGQRNEMNPWLPLGEAVAAGD